MTVLGKFLNFAGKKKTVLASAVGLGLYGGAYHNHKKLKAQERIHDVTTNLEKMILFR